MTAVSHPESAGSASAGAPALELAGRGRRLAATLIDVVAVPALAIVLMLVTGVLEHAEDWRAGANPLARGLLLGLASYLLLNTWLLWRRGQTLGKALTGIAIESVTGDRAPLWRLLLRALFFPTLYLLPVPGPFVVPLLDQAFIVRKDRRCLHDLLCRTQVIHVLPGK